MKLQCRQCPLVVVATLDSVTQSTRLLASRSQDKHLTGIHNSTDTYGESLGRYLRDIATKEARIHGNSVGREGLDACTRLERREGLVEGDMAILAYATHKEVDATRCNDSSLVGSTLRNEILGITVEDVYILLADIHMAEEVVPHKRVVALGVLLGKTYILIHIKGHYILERHLASLMQADKLTVGLQRCRACRKTQYEWFVCNSCLSLDLLDNVGSSPLGNLCTTILDDYSHILYCIFYSKTSLRRPR